MFALLLGTGVFGYFVSSFWHRFFFLTSFFISFGFCDELVICFRSPTTMFGWGRTSSIGCCFQQRYNLTSELGSRIGGLPPTLANGSLSAPENGLLTTPGSHLLQIYMLYTYREKNWICMSLCRCVYMHVRGYVCNVCSVFHACKICKSV